MCAARAHSLSGFSIGFRPDWPVVADPARSAYRRERRSTQALVRTGTRDLSIRQQAAKIGVSRRFPPDRGELVSVTIR